MNSERKTYTRVEHINGENGARFHYIARHPVVDEANRNDPNWYRATEKRPGFFHKLLDSLNGMFYRR